MAREYIMCMVVLACVVGTHAQFDAMGAYTPVSDVIEHAKPSQDVCDIIDHTKTSDWAECKTIYTEGKNSNKGEGMRTLQDLAEKESGSALWQIFAGYKGGNNAWINTLEMAALDGTNGYDAKEDFRVQVVKKIPQHLILPLYTMHELDSALDKIEDNNLDYASGAPHAWDEGWAFYFGNDDDKGGCNDGAPYGNSDSRGGDFEKGTENADAQAVQFNRGRDACVAGDASTAKAARDEISRLMKIPLIQAVLKYSLKLDTAVAAGNGDIDKYQGEAFAFYQFLEAQIGAADDASYGKVGADQEGAKKLADRFAVSATPAAGNYADAYCVLDLSMAKWDITWAEVGTYKDYTAGTVDCVTRETTGLEPVISSAPALGVIRGVLALLGSTAAYIAMM